MTILRLVLLMALGLTVAGCGKFPTYNGPEVTHVLVDKGERRMHLIHHDEVLESYDIGLGFAPNGDKKIEGDGKTPEGAYIIDRRNPNSAYHLSVGISYPNANDRAFAEAVEMVLPALRGKARRIARNRGFVGKLAGRLAELLRAQDLRGHQRRTARGDHATSGEFNA